jgi:hypothetical protein
LFLQYFAEQLQLALCVGRVGNLWVNLCAALQPWLTFYGMTKISARRFRF